MVSGAGTSGRSAHWADSSHLAQAAPHHLSHLEFLACLYKFRASFPRITFL
jgi:hypothetical protein